MLRKLILGFAILATLGGGYLVLAHGPAALGPLVMGVLLLIGLLAERVTYKRLADRPPDPRFQPTGERFRDPASGAVVEAYADPKTGERVYVRS
jgi:hypothetical protein